MDVAEALGLVAIVILVLANGFFVATEFAIVAIRHSRLEECAAKGDIRAKAVLDVYIAACQLGITMSFLALGWIGEATLARMLEAPLERLVDTAVPTLAHSIAIAIAFSVITALHIVARELAPKGLALQKVERQRGVNAGAA